MICLAWVGWAEWAVLLEWAIWVDPEDIFLDMFNSNVILQEACHHIIANHHTTQ
jgi:hypothetical protein